MIERYTLPPLRELWSDEARYQRWLQVELAVCRAWAAAGKIPAAAMAEIRRRAGYDLKRVRELEAAVGHDVIAFLTAVAERVGPSSRYIHLGLTSNDVVDTAQALALKRAADIIIAELDAVIAAAAALALKHKYTVMVGRTHGIHAEPTTFGLKMLVFHQELLRGKERIQRARQVIAVGKLSGAVGTLAQVDPVVEARALKALGLKPAAATTQVVQRDRHAEYITACALLGATLEKIALEIRGLQRTEVGEAAEPFRRGQKGSSAMPHKRNPELAERICGLARLLRGYALTALENVALWHERDISHSSAERVILPDATTVLHYMLDRCRYILEGLEIRRDRMQANLELTKGLVFSGRVLVELAAAGATREAAYDVVQRVSQDVSQGRLPSLREGLAREPLIKKYLPGKKLTACFDAGYYLRNVDYIFARAGLKKTVKAK